MAMGAVSIAVCMVSPCLASTPMSEGFGVKNISVAEGLSQSRVNSLDIDQQGFLWVGTDDGLDRFDGSRFVHVDAVVSGGMSPMRKARIERVEVDGAGNVWTLCSQGEIRCLDPRRERYVDLVDKKGGYAHLEGGRFSCLSNSDVLIYGSLSGTALFRTDEAGEVSCQWCDTARYTCHVEVRDAIWLGGRRLTILRNDGSARSIKVDGLTAPIVSMTVCGHTIIISDGSDVLRRVDMLTESRLPDVSLGGKNVKEVVSISDELVLVPLSAGGLTMYNATSGERVPLTAIGGCSLAYKNVRSIKDAECGVWLDDGCGTVYHYDELNGIVRPVVMREEGSDVPASDSGVSIIPDVVEPGVYWVSSLGYGLVRYDENRESYRRVKNKNAYVPEYIQCIRQDKSGNIWIGSDGVGLVKISLHRYVSHTLRPGDPSRFSASNNVVTVMESVDGNVWAGVKNGPLYVYDSFLRDKLFSRNDIRPSHITADNRGRVWVGTNGLGVYVFDLTTFSEINHLTHRPDNANTLASDDVVKVLVDRDGRVWFVMSNGCIDMFDGISRHNNRVRHFFAGNAEAEVTTTDAILDSEGLMWVATNEELICFAPQRLVKDAEDYVRYKFDNNLPEEAATGAIRAICEDSKRRIYVGMTGGGLCRLSFDVGHVRLTRFDENDGLPSKQVTAITIANDTTLWVATENGLSLFDTQENKFTVIKTAETDFGNLFNSHACARRQNGNILWGTFDGIADFDPHRRIRSEMPEPPFISDIFIDNKRVNYADGLLDAAASFATKAKVPVSTSELKFCIADKGLSGGRLSDFVYKLEGYDDEWRTIPQRREVSFHGLERGDYKFLVYDRVGGLSTLRSIDVEVWRPWWQTMAQILAFVLGAGVLVFLSWTIMRTMKGKTAEAIAEDRATEYKDGLLTSLNNEIVAPIKKIQNSLAAIRGKRNGVSDEVSPLISVVEQNMEKLSGMVDSMLVQKDAAAQMPLNLEMTLMTTFMTEVINGFDNSLALRKKTTTRLQVAGGWRVLVDHGKLSKMLQVLLGCAYKHAPEGGEVIVAAYQNHDQQCVIDITDYGQGVPSDRRGIVFGAEMSAPRNGVEAALAAVSDFAKSHHGEVRYEPVESGGTKMTILLPTDYSAYTDANIVSSSAAQMPDDDDLMPNRNASSIEEKARIPVVLIVEDNDNVRNFLADRLRPSFTVITADSARAAQGKMAVSVPDIVICEAYMEPMSGIDLLRYMRSDFSVSHIPAFILTNDTTTVELEAAGGIPHCRAIEKPIDYVVLKDEVRQAAERVLNLRLNFENNYGVTGTPSKADLEFMASFVGQIEANAARANFGIEDVAAELHIPSNELTVMVLSLTGCTPGEYVKLWRLDRVRRAMALGRESLTMAMQNSGITDVEYFNKCFIRTYGDLLSNGMQMN